MSRARRVGERALRELRFQAARTRLAMGGLDDRALVVCGSPRSGTTWVGESLATLTRAIALFEPLHPGQTPAGRAGFEWRTFDGLDDIPAERLAYLRDALAGRVRNRWIIKDQSLRRTVASRRLLVKFVRANGLLPVLGELPECRPPLVVVRHPVATVDSQLRHGHWRRPEGIDFTPFVRRWPRYAEAVEDLHHPEEFLAAAWCSEFVPVEAGGAPRAWMVVHYEAVRRDPAGVLGRVLAEWGLESGISVDFEQPSRTTRGSGVSDAGRYELEEAQIERVLAVVRRFGITAYDAAPDPVAELPLVGVPGREMPLSAALLSPEAERRLSSEGRGRRPGGR